jgi:hypothetical protein
MTDVIAICNICGKNKICGQTCSNCYDDSNISVYMAKYAVAMKEALQCWREGECEEHEIPCQPTIKQFATKLYHMNARIKALEVAIESHQKNKQNPDAVDSDLWKIL